MEMVCAGHMTGLPASTTRAQCRDLPRRQSDPLTQNRYAVAGGNPVNRVEWDGHCSDACSGQGYAPGGGADKRFSGGGGGGGEAAAQAAVVAQAAAITAGVAGSRPLEERWWAKGGAAAVQRVPRFAEGARASR